MMKYIKKHPILTILVLLPFVGYIYLYFTNFRYDADRSDFRHYPIPPLTEKWSKTIEYKALPYVKFNKYFLITFNSTQLKKNLENQFGAQYYDEVYQRKYSLYHTENITKEQFYAETKEKPQLLLKIYKDGVLVETQKLYFSNFKSHSEMKIGEREFFAVSIIGRPGYQQGYGYLFAEDADYKLEIINNTTDLPEFKNVEIFFTIRPITPKV